MAAVDRWRLTRDDTVFNEFELCMWGGGGRRERTNHRDEKEQSLQMEERESDQIEIWRCNPLKQPPERSSLSIRYSHSR